MVCAERIRELLGRTKYDEDENLRCTVAKNGLRLRLRLRLKLKQKKNTYKTREGERQRERVKETKNKTSTTTENVIYLNFENVTHAHSCRVT